MTHCICASIRKLSAMPAAAFVVLVASLGALGSAFVAQHYFDILPCILCLFQRIPYAAALILATLAVLFRNDPRKSKALLYLIAIAFLINVGIAAFHTGVERHWWSGTNGCSVKPLNAELTREQLLAEAVSQCDEINFEIFGLTFANLNVLACLLLSGFSFAAARRVGKKDKEDPACGCRCGCAGK